MNRREFTKIVGIGGVALATIPLTSCGLADDIINWGPVGKATIDSVMLVLSSNGIVAGPAILMAQKDADAAIDLLIGAAQAYKATTPPPVGTLQNLQAAFTAVTSKLGAFLQAVALPPVNILNLIIGIAQIMFSTITAFMNRLPPPVAASLTTTTSAQHTVGNVPFSVVPKERTRRAFKKDVNSVLDSGKKAGVTVPDAAYLHLSLFEHL